MQELETILRKIEAPLIFASKESFSKLHLIKDLEACMSGLIVSLKSAIITISIEDSTRNNIYDKISELEKIFLHFDNLEEVDKQTRIEKALHITETVKDLVSMNLTSMIPEEKQFPYSVGEINLSRCFEKLSLPVQFIKGIGPKISQLLGKKNIKTVEDLLYFLPRKYEDRRFVKKIASTTFDKRETVVGNVIDARIHRYKKSRIFEVVIDDGSDRLTAKWFHGNYGYLKRTFKKGHRFILTGEIKSYLFGRDMIHPDFELLSEKDDELLHFKRIVPIYSETAGLHQKYLRKILMQVISEYSEFLPSPIPGAICRRNRLTDMVFAIKNIHFPDSDQDIQSYNSFKSVSHRRIIFDEFFFFELGMALKKKGYVLERGISFLTGGSLVQKFFEILPFELTGAQKRVVGEIETDMRRNSPMHRLLQGDVGSGKTVVSMVAMITACENNHQSAIMAPTEILAEQHFSNIETWARSLGLTVALLTGSTKGKERKDIIAGIERGSIDIVVGTHALIQEGVAFKNLGLIVIDEQHRFGVIQRATLREKGMNPDVLVMTATPIPRTLAMTVYGDLDLSVIDELPPGKKPIKTKVFYEQQRSLVYERIQKELIKGNQAFIVYPLVEESENLDLKDATSMAHHLSQDIFPDYNVGLVHGKMKNHEKNRIMSDFLKGSLNILVSTTVIEVGIDIPTASLMVIEHAERFGLSQLHQLRGRVGRSDLPSFCILIAHHQGTEDSRRRLRIMEQTNDGFKIAEEDLVIRGPGEFLGTRQSGLPDFRVANILRDATLLNTARREAFSLIQDDPNLELPEHGLLKEALLKKWEGRLDIAHTG